uniref:Uncharacterized protein n=1 Tax=Arundo donax TaxID=35708 RepID=A0A0A9CQH5_ARUDO
MSKMAVAWRCLEGWTPKSCYLTDPAQSCWYNSEDLEGMDPEGQGCSGAKKELGSHPGASTPHR